MIKRRQKKQEELQQAQPVLPRIDYAGALTALETISIDSEINMTNTLTCAKDILDKQGIDTSNLIGKLEASSIWSRTQLKEYLKTLVDNHEFDLLEEFNPGLDYHKQLSPFFYFSGEYISHSHLGIAEKKPGYFRGIDTTSELIRRITSYVNNLKKAEEKTIEDNKKSKRSLKDRLNYK